MSHITSGILGGTAAVLLMSAVQFASGSDLRATIIPVNRTEASQVNAEAVNRSAKSDRAPVNVAAESGRTLSFRVHSSPETSLLLRVAPTEVKAEPISVKPQASTPPRVIRSATQKPAVACEPPVSALTDIAKLLEPGRCVT